MLILTRRVGETITIRSPAGHVLKIQVAKFCGKDRVKLVFSGNREMEVARTELLRNVEFDLAPHPLLERKEAERCPQES